MRDGCIETGVDAFVEEHRVEHPPCRSLEAERHVGDAEHGVDPRQLGLDPLDCFDGLHRIAAEVVVARGEWERERIEDQVGRFKAVFVDGEVVDPVRHLHLPLDVAGLAPLVDEEADDGGAVLTGQRKDAAGSGVGAVAVLEVRGVEHAAPSETLEPSLHHLRLGRVEHDGSGNVGGESRRQQRHVGNAVPADVVDAEVDEVSRLLHLVFSDADTCVDVVGQHRLPERLRTVGIGPLADDEERGVLGEADPAVDRGRRGKVFRRSVCCPKRPNPVDDGCDVVGSRAAAAADHPHAELLDEVRKVACQFLGGEVIRHLTIDHLGQPGVRDARNRNAGVRREVAKRLVHLFRTGCAVQTDDVGAEGIDGRERSADLGAGEHPAGQLDGDLHLERHLAPGVGHGAAGTVDRGANREQVELGLDDQQVRSAVDEPGGLHLVGVSQSR